MAAYSAVVVLVLAHLLFLAAGPVGVTLEMPGYQDFAAKVLIIAALVNVALNAALIPLFGMLGAAYATGASLVLLNALSLYGVVRHLHVDPTLLGRK